MKRNAIIFFIIFINISIIKIVIGNTTKFLNTNYTLDFIRNSAKVIKCTPNKKCPHYSGGCHIMDLDIHSNTYGSGYCNLSFICRQDKNCVAELKEEILFSENTHSYLNTQTYDLREGFSEIKDKLFVSSCKEEGIDVSRINKENNNCNSNDNCYSNTCLNGICVSDPLNPTYYCSLVYHDTKKEPVIECSPIDLYKCKMGETCSSNYCNNFKRNEMITEQEIDGLNGTGGSNKINWRITILISILIFFPFYLFIFF